MKKLLLLTLTLCLLLSTAHAMDHDEMREAMDRCFPEWKTVDTFDGWDGMTAILMQVDGLTLRLCWVFDPSDWIVEEVAPVPLTEEAAERFRTFDGQFGWDYELPEDMLEGCADFMLPEGESWSQLFAFETNLAGISRSTEDTYHLVIAHWNGTAFDRIESTMPQTVKLWIFGNHSADGVLNLMTDREDLDELYIANETGAWRMDIINTDKGYFRLYDDHLVDIGLAWDQNNENYIYGDCLIPQKLEAIDLSLPLGTTLNEVVDASACACTAHDDTPMFASPGSDQLGTVYTRTAGRITAEEGDWVRLHIGEKDAGFNAWFLRSDLAFGEDVNRMLCSFPTIILWDEQTGETLGKALDMDADSVRYMIESAWLVGHDPEGRLLVLLDNAQLLTLDADAITYVPETEHFQDDDLSWEEYWHSYDE